MAAMRQWQVIPKQVLLDNDGAFRGKLLAAFCHNLGIELIHSSPYGIPRPMARWNARFAMTCQNSIGTTTGGTLTCYGAIYRRMSSTATMSEVTGLPTICQPEFDIFFTTSVRPAHDEFGWRHSRCHDATWRSEYAAVGRQYCARPGYAVVPSPAKPHIRY